MCRMTLAMLVGLPFVVGCPAEGNRDGADGGTPEGALACDKAPVACRETFADNYEGTYAGSKTGRVILDIDALGGIVGTATKMDGTSVAMFGEVDEFGQLTLSDDDGTEWRGQFTQERQLSGTWAGTDDSNGTFVAASTTRSAATSTDDSTPSPPTQQPSGDVSASAAAAAALSACEATRECEGMTANCAEIEAAGESATAPPECRAAELSLYDCMVENGCNSEVACNALFLATFDCTLGGSATVAPAPSP
jgi:hypothetical protein